MRVLPAAVFAFAYLSAAVPAAADDGASAALSMPLQRPAAKADGSAFPLRTSVRYFPLKPQQPRFMPIQHAARAVAARAPAADDLPPDPPSDQTPLPSVMTPEQAQQILSLFSASE